MRQLSLQLTSKPPWLVLLISLSISFFAAYITNNQAQKAGHERFQRHAEKLNHDIVHRLETYLSLLRAGVGVFNASEHVGRTEWQRFVDSLEIDQAYKGIQGIGYAQYLDENNKQIYIDGVRAEGFENFELVPAGKRDFYTPVTYLEPFDWRNQRAFGYDMFSEPVRRNAMERARDTGEASISGYVVLMQETTEDTQPGFLMYLPVYKFQSDPGTIDARRSQLTGFVYAPFRMYTLLEDIHPSGSNALKFRIFDTDSDGNELFNSDPNNDYQFGDFSVGLPINFSGRTWQLAIASTQSYDAAQGDNSALLVFVAGLVDSLLLFVMALALYAHKRSTQENSIRLEEQLHLSKKFQQMADFAPTALVTVDKNGKIDLFNQEALRLFGYAEDELLGCSVEQLVPQRFRHEHPTYRANYLEKPEQRAMGSGRDLYCQTKSGVELPVEIAIMPAQLNKSGYTVCSIVNISERKKQENLLRRKSAELEQFVYAVSHDLKSPLVAISGLAEMVLHSFEADTSVDATAHIKRIVANAQQMETLLNDLLELSRVAYKQLELEEIELSAFVAELKVLHCEAVNFHGGTLAIRYSGEVFFAHKTLLLQLFANLIGNSVKYREISRPLTIEIGINVVATSAVDITVSDNGIGIEPGWQSRVFDLFVRRDGGDEVGSGVGLSICKTVVDRHHGTIGVESKLGVGTTFIVAIPVNYTLEN